MSWVLVQLCEDLEEFLDSLSFGESEARLQVVQTARGPRAGETRPAYPVVRCTLSAVVYADPPCLIRYIEETDLLSTEGAVHAGRAFALRALSEGCVPTTGEWKVEDVPSAVARWQAEGELLSAEG